MNTEYEQKVILFLQSAEAPQYIVWHTSNFGQMALDGLNNEYLLNEMPFMTETILANYQLTPYADEHVALYKKRAKPLAIEKTEKMKDTEAAWGDWVDVPKADSGTFIEASAFTATSTFYPLLNFIYKGAPVYIDYETTDGRTLHFRFRISTAKEAIFVNPIWTDPYLKQTGIKRIRFSNKKPMFFPENVRLQWRQVRISGL